MTIGEEAARLYLGLSPETWYWMSVRLASLILIFPGFTKFAGENFDLLTILRSFLPLIIYLFPLPAGFLQLRVLLQICLLYFQHLRVNVECRTAAEIAAAETAEEEAETEAETVEEEAEAEAEAEAETEAETVEEEAEAEAESTDVDEDEDEEEDEDATPEALLAAHARIQQKIGDDGPLRPFTRDEIWTLDLASYEELSRLWDRVHEKQLSSRLSDYVKGHQPFPERYAVWDPQLEWVRGLHWFEDEKSAEDMAKTIIERTIGPFPNRVYCDTWSRL